MMSAIKPSQVRIPAVPTPFVTVISFVVPVSVRNAQVSSAVRTRMPVLVSAAMARKSEARPLVNNDARGTSRKIPDVLSSIAIYAVEASLIGPGESSE